MDERHQIDEEAQLRRRRIAAAGIPLPSPAGFVIAGIVWLAGGEETEVTKPEGQTTASSPHRVEAASAAEAGTPAPRGRLTEGGSGKGFDGAALAGEPYAVVFISTRCAALGGFLHRVAADLGPGEGAVLAISADPAVDTAPATRAHLSPAPL